MNYRVSTDPVELRRLGWEELVLSHPEGTVFQSPAMYELFSRTEKMEPVVIGAIERESGKMKGVVLGVIIREMKGPAGYFSSRTVVYGGPLVKADTDGLKGVTGLLLEHLVRQVRYRSVFIQFRNFRDMKGEEDVFEAYRFKYRDRLNFLVDTRYEQRVKERMGSEKYRQVKKGLKNGAEIVSPASETDMREFYDILHDLYRTKVKKPLPDWSFFREFYRLSLEDGLGVVRLVKYHGKVIGGILCPVSPNKTIYEWYVCGMDQEYKEAYPSVLATWAAIDHAMKNGLETFDFMGVGIPGRTYGVRTFKARFGGEMVNFGRYARINNRLLYFISEMGYNLLSLMKRI